MKNYLLKLSVKIKAYLRSILKVSSIQSIMTLSFTAVIVLSLLFVSLTLYSMFFNNAERNAAASTKQIMDQVNVNLNTYLKGMIEISDVIRSNFGPDSYNDKIELAKLLDVTTKIRRDIVTLTVYSDNGKLLLSSPSDEYNNNYKAEEQSWFKDALSKPVDNIFTAPHVQRIFTAKRPWVVSLCRSTNFFKNNSEQVTWVTVVDMNFSTIEQLCREVSFGKRGYIYIIDNNGNIIYHPQQQIVYAGLKNENINDALSRTPGTYFDNFQGERRIMAVQNINYTNWKMVGISYVDELVVNKRNLASFVIFISLFGIAFAILASMFISAKISQPIKRLEKQMKKVENGDFDIKLDVQGEDEVKRLSRTFNLMVSRIRQLMAQIIADQEDKRKSEFKALQAQINPHFLYNTLDSIIWMNENGNYKGVSTMVSALAKLFRVSISKGKETNSVADEIEHARSYLIIQKIRYKDKFDFTIDVQPDLLDKKTVKLILQPIIENAIYHGINQIQEKGEIRITAAAEQDKLVFRISDNGYGIRPEVLNGLMERESTSTSGSGVGLKNVNERIKLRYGDEYGLKIESELDEGTTVIISIPLDDAGGGKYERTS